MFWKQITRWSKSLYFRLGFFYSLIFGIISSLAIWGLNFMISTHVMHGVDLRLLEQKRAVEHYAAFHDHRIIHGKFLDEAGARGTSRVFYRLISPHGEQEVSSNQSSWHNLSWDKAWIEKARTQDMVFSDMILPDHRKKARVLSTLTGKDHVLQIVVSIENEISFLTKVHTASIGLVISMLVAGIFAGTIMAKKAISGLEEVTLAVSRVAEGDFKERVVLHGTGSELMRLGKTYNKMADRIEALIREIHEVNDNIAHDLRSPVTSIRGIAEMAALEKNLPSEIIESMGCIVEECDRLICLINTMLEISEAEAGIGSITVQKIKSNELISKTIEMFLPMGEEAGVELEVKDLSEFDVHGDIRKIQRIIGNLVDNAIKYTQPGGKVSISSFTDETVTGFEISDTGVGIPQNCLPKIFDRFYRGDLSRSRPGNGLGLSLALAFARAHNGDIQITSHPGKGTTSVFSIPLTG